jgi:lysyl-tRNA synthetase class 2
MVDAIKDTTGVDVLAWKDLKAAKEAVRKLGIKSSAEANLATITTLGELIAFTFEEKVEETLTQPTIIYDYPVEVSPLAKKCENDPRFAERFEYFAFGFEIGNNYSELNDPVDLKKRFVDEKKREDAGFEEAHQFDQDYLDAVAHGMAPNCGVAIGVDRMAMLLTDTASIKEVIIFPTMRPL